MLRDKILVGVLIGLLANAVKLTVNYLAYLFGFTKVVFWQIVATNFLDKSDLFSPAAYLIGAAADLTVASLLGITFIYAIDFIGRENLWLRGVGLGLVAWVVLFGTVLGKTVQDKIPQEPSGIMVTLVAHFVYGVSFAIFTTAYYKISEKTAGEKKNSFYFTPAPAPARKVKTFHIINKNEQKPKIEKLKKPRKI